MSTLISSAVGGGRKAAPKAVARRRPPPKPAKSALPTEQAVPAPDDERTINDSPIVPAFQHLDETQPSNGDSAASAGLLEDPPQHVDSGSAVAASTTEHTGLLQSQISMNDISRTAHQTEADNPVGAVEQAASAITIEHSVQSNQATSSRSGKKRQCDNAELGENISQEPKRVRRASTRTRTTAKASSASLVSPAADETAPAFPLTTTLQTNQGGRSKRNASRSVDKPSNQSATGKKTRGSSQAKTRTRKARESKAQSTSKGSGTRTGSGEEEMASTQEHASDTLPAPATTKTARRRTQKGNAKGSHAGDARENGANVNTAGHCDDKEDPEAHQIDPTSLTMFDLSKDEKHGKTSEREKKMAEIDWDEVARKRREAFNAPAEAESQSKGIVQSTEGPDGTAESESADSSAPAPAPPPPPGAAGVQFRVVDGQIVVDETSITIDRQAQAEAEALIDVPVLEETDLTTRINRTTWINDRRRDVAERVPLHKSRSDPWSFEETERLYEALAMFGTDYFTIAQMFPPKTRKQIKLKVLREEKIDPERINAAMLGRHTPMSLEYYAQATGRDVSDFTKHGSLEQASARIAEDLKDKEEAMRAALAMEAENEKNRETFEKEQARAKLAKKKSSADRKSRKKGPAGGTMGGVPFEQVGEIVDADD